MSERGMLRRNLAAAWESTMARYCEGVINSERGLQVHFVRFLFDEFDRVDVKRQVFVEPSFKDSLQLRSPDLVICNTRKIIGVVELKYLPRIRPKYAKDLRTLEWFARSGENVKLLNMRYLGKPLRQTEFVVAPDVVLCWSGVYRAPKAQMTLPTGLPPERLFCMHALTKEGDNPTCLFSNGDNP